MKRETLDFLGRSFGDRRFTVADYIGPRVPRPWESKDIAEEFEAATREGLLVLAPGPRGGKGFRLSPHQFKLYQQRAEAAERRAERDRKAYEAGMRARKSAEIEAAIRLLESNGYKVVGPAAATTS